MGMFAKIFACGILLSLVAAGFATFCGEGVICPNEVDGQLYNKCCTILLNGERSPGCCLDVGIIAGPVVAATVVASIVVLIGVCMCCRFCPCCECCKRTPCYRKEVVRDREKGGLKIADRKLGGKEDPVEQHRQGSYDVEQPALYQEKA